MEKMLGYIFLNFSKFSNSKVTSEISGLRVPLTSSQQISFKTFGDKNASTNIKWLWKIDFNIWDLQYQEILYFFGMLTQTNRFSSRRFLYNASVHFCNRYVNSLWWKPIPWGVRFYQF